MDLVPPSPLSSASATAAPAPTSSAIPTVDDRATTFRPVTGGPALQSGERLLVEAYAAIWILLFGMVLLSLRRQQRIEARIAGLEAAIAKTRESQDPKGPVAQA